MKQHFLFLLLTLFVFSCTETESEKKETTEEEDSFFDFFDDTESTEEEVAPSFEEEIKETEVKEVPKESEKVIKEEVKEDLPLTSKENIEEEKKEEVKEEPLEEVKEVDKLVIVDYQEFHIRFKTKETFDIHEIEFPEKLKEKGLIKRYKTEQSYFDVYDMQKAIDWSGAGNFAEFGQGFYERSKGVSGGKFCIYAKRRAFSFNTKISFKDNLNYSNIKKLKSDEEVKKEDLVDATVIFFGKGKYGYRYIYNNKNEVTKISSETMEVY